MFGAITKESAVKANEKEVTNLETIDTLISSNVEIDGNIISSGTVRLDCKITGDVTGNGIIIGETGSVKGNIDCTKIIISGSSVKGNINCTDITISGNVEGNIFCNNKLHLKDSASLIGDVCVGTIVIDEGAVFKGICEMQTEESSFVSKNDSFEASKEDCLEEEFQEESNEEI